MNFLSMNNFSCKICKKKHLKKNHIIKFPSLKFISGDYRYIKYSKFYNLCPNTNFIFTNVNQTWLKNINTIYKNYSFSLGGIYSGKTTREHKIYKTIKKNLKIKKSEVLEIGPGTGALINKLNDIKNIKKIDAYELNSKYLNLFNKNNKFGKLYKNIDKINKKYDLIILSHSFFHLVNLYEDISKIKSLLKKNGLLIIITPDPLNYPVLPFIYEIFSFSNKNNILSYLEKFGLFINRDLKSVLKNEIFVILSRIKSQKRVNKDKNFLKKFKTIQKKLLIKIQILKKEKALIIEGAGIGGTFFLYNLKKNIFKIYDKYLGTNMIINKKLKDIKIKKNIKSFNINKILKTYN